MERAAPVGPRRGELVFGGELALNHEGLREACAALRMSSAVARLTNLRRFGGRYVGIRNGRHSITVSKVCGWAPGEASRVLWHELAHARQVERIAREQRCSLGDAFARFEALWFEQMVAAGITLAMLRRGEYDLATYNSTALEVDANDLADTFCSQLVLVTYAPEPDDDDG